MKRLDSKARRGSSAIRSVATVALMAASLECAKLSLAALPNIEAVSILLAVYGYAFGWHGAVAAVLFCCIEPLIWGFGPWLPAYFCYWPAVALVFRLFRSLSTKGRTDGQSFASLGADEQKSTCHIATEPDNAAPVPKKSGKRRVALAAAMLAVILTFLFGIITAVWEICIFSGNPKNLWQRFIIYYARGAAFYITHIVSNGVIFALLFLPLTDALMKIKRKFNL